MSHLLKRFDGLLNPLAGQEGAIGEESDGGPAFPIIIGHVGQRHQKEPERSRFNVGFVGKVDEFDTHGLLTVEIRFDINVLRVGQKNAPTSKRAIFGRTDRGSCVWTWFASSLRAQATMAFHAA